MIAQAVGAHEECILKACVVQGEPHSCEVRARDARRAIGWCVRIFQILFVVQAEPDMWGQASQRAIGFVCNARTEWTEPYKCPTMKKL